MWYAFRSPSGRLSPLFPVGLAAAYLLAALHEVLFIMVFKVIENNPDLIICVQTCGSLKRSETKWVVQCFDVEFCWHDVFQMIQ